MFPIVLDATDVPPLETVAKDPPIPAADKSTNEAIHTVFDDEISRLRQELSNITLTRLCLQQKLKHARKCEQECAETLEHVLQRAREPSLFSAPAQAPADDREDETTDVEYRIESGWRATSVEGLGLPEGICRALRENPTKPICCLGDLADWSADDHPLTEIPQIGDRKAEAIEQACEQYWAEHGQPMAQGAAEAAEGV